MNMATLSVRGTDYSVTKQKALEDAKKMQATVDEDCMRVGKEPPPYLLQELIGKGSFGRVYKAKDLTTARLVAVKIIDIEESDTLNPKLADTYSEFLKEINALKLLSDGSAKNINHIVDALPVGQSMWMITEYCAGGSVATLMKPTAPGGLQEKWIIPILREVAEAIFWVHRQGIIHRDIKCANVLVTEAGGVQLCDFGVAGVIETKFDKRSTFIGTPHWMAPELFDQSTAYGTEVDIWAFGSMVFEIASGLPPNVMAGINITQLGNYIKQHTPRLEGDRYSQPLKDLVAFCLEEDPSKRPPIEKVQMHPYIFNTSAAYPSSSLAMLVRGYKLWESQGGSRKSLFAAGGAQGPLNNDFSSTALANDEWNFSTTIDFDRRVFETPDAQAVFDVYGSQVDYAANFSEETSRPSKLKSRRRPPPHLNNPLKAPLEKVFDPNTITNYEDNAREYYGKPIPPPTSDLPLRDDSLHSTLRESLIDLDASQIGGGETIRPPYQGAVDDGLDDADISRPPLSDPQDMPNNRRTQDWKFPSAAPPASANPEMSHFPFNEDRSGRRSGSGSGGRPSLAHHPTDPSGLISQNYDLMVPRVQDNRASMSSLIDLDESLPDPPDLTRPSTAHSDAGSITGSDIGVANPFDLERHASLYQPINVSNREPSIYVSDDSDFARLAKAPDGMMDGELPTEERSQRRAIESYLNDTGVYSGDEYVENDYLTMVNRQTTRRQPTSNQIRQSYSDSAVATLPAQPEPPSSRVMQGMGSRQEVREELQRMLASFQDHLSFANTHVSNLPIRRGGGASRLEQSIED